MDERDTLKKRAIWAMASDRVWDTIIEEGWCISPESPFAKTHHATLNIAARLR